MNCNVMYNTLSVFFTVLSVQQSADSHKKKKQQQQHTYTQTKPPQHLLNMLKTTVKTITFCLPPV